MRAALRSRVLPFVAPPRAEPPRWRRLLLDLEVASIAVVTGTTLVLFVLLWQLWQLTSLALSHFLGLL